MKPARYALHAGDSRLMFEPAKQDRIALLPEIARIIADNLSCDIDELVGHEVTRMHERLDPKQEKLNGCHESLNDGSKTEAADMAASIAAGPARRIEKRGESLWVMNERWEQRR